MGLLSLFGLMKRSEHERDVAYLQNMEKAAIEVTRLWEAKFKQAVADLADARCSLEDERATFNQRLADAVQDYQADALAMRRKRQMDRDRRRMGK